MAVKIEVGKTYELNNGDVHECVRMAGGIQSTDLGPYVIGGVLYHQDGRFGTSGQDHPYSVKREVITRDPELTSQYGDGNYPLPPMTTKTGTLAELKVQPGDLVEHVESGTVHKPMGYDCDGKLYSEGQIEGYAWMTEGDDWRIISRASDKPKTWGEMTDAEKGAIALAFIQGKTVQCWQDFDTPEYWADIQDPNWNDDCKFRIKPEPKRETVTIGVASTSIGEWYQPGTPGSPSTHRITFTTSDGKPDLDSIKVEEV